MWHGKWSERHTMVASNSGTCDRSVTQMSSRALMPETQQQSLHRHHHPSYRNTLTLRTSVSVYPRWVRCWYSRELLEHIQQRHKQHEKWFGYQTTTKASKVHAMFITASLRSLKSYVMLLNIFPQSCIFEFYLFWIKAQKTNTLFQQCLKLQWYLA